MILNSSTSDKYFYIAQVKKRVKSPVYFDRSRIFNIKRMFETLFHLDWDAIFLELFLFSIKGDFISGLDSILGIGKVEFLENFLVEILEGILHVFQMFLNVR